jgi:hypothetical protein
VCISTTNVQVQSRDESLVLDVHARGCGRAGVVRHSTCLVSELEFEALDLSAKFIEFA